MALALAAALVSAPVNPARAEDVGPLTDSYFMFDVQVGGTYVPIPLRFACNQGGLAILWYGRGTAPDALWTNIVDDNGTLTYVSRSVRIDGVYQPVAGDLDGNGCTDILWYRPGPASDPVWWYGPNLTHTNTTEAVNGAYIPIVGRFDYGADAASDILWYAPGTGRETIWQGQVSKSFVSRPAPQVYGTYRPSVLADDNILWYAPGGGQDHLWDRVRYQSPKPLADHLVTVGEDYAAHTVSGRPFLYQPGPLQSRAVFGIDGTDLVTTVGQIDGTYVVAATNEVPLLVFHAPGSATDHIWIRA